MKKCVECGSGKYMTDGWDGYCRPCSLRFFFTCNSCSNVFHQDTGLIDERYCLCDNCKGKVRMFHRFIYDLININWYDNCKSNKETLALFNQLEDRIR